MMKKNKRKGHHTVDFQSNGYGKGSVIFITGIGRINIQREREREREREKENPSTKG